MNSSEDIPPRLLKILETGVDRGAERLAKISRTNWIIQTVSVRLAQMSRVAAMAENEGTDYGIFLSMDGGGFLVVFPEAEAKAMASAFLTQTEWEKPGSRMEEMALSEIANVVANAIADLLADACGRAVFLAAPVAERKKAVDLLQELPKRFPAAGAQTLLVYAHMSSSSLSADCMVAIILDDDWQKALLTVAEAGK